MEVVDSLICMAKFPWVAHSIAHVQPMGSEVGSSPVFFRMGVDLLSRSAMARKIQTWYMYMLSKKLPIKFCQISFSAMRGAVENVSANQEAMAAIFVDRQPEKHKLSV